MLRFLDFFSDLALYGFAFSTAASASLSLFFCAFFTFLTAYSFSFFLR